MKTVEMRRVVITGVGAVTPVGNTAEEFWAALIQGKSGIGPITRFDATPLPTRIAGELKGFDPLRYMDKKDDRKLDPFLKYAIACAAMAVEDAGLNVERVDRTRFGVLVGSGIGGISTLLETHKILLEKGPDRVSPFFIPMLIVNMASGLISMRFGAKGPNSSIVTACATGNHAIGDAMKIIQRNDADVMIAGGSEAIILPLTFADPATYDHIGQRDRISVVGLAQLTPDLPVSCRITTPDGTTTDFTCTHTFSPEQIEWFKAGSALNIIRQKQTG